MNKNDYSKVSFKAILKGASSNKINIPNDVINQLGWKINEKLNIDICYAENHINDKWKEIVITKESDEYKVYKEN